MDRHVSNPSELPQKFQRFRILVIGRANAGKTTLLNRVCNTTEEPCIYDEQARNLLEPTADRGIHDINQSFSFSSNPQFIFHDSPGFEKGGVKELEDVQQFIKNRAEAANVEDQLHAIWFCLVTNAAKPLSELEERFFKEKQFGNVPVIAIFTKFDDLVTLRYDDDLEDIEIRNDAAAYVEDKIRKPLAEYDYPPSAYLCLEDMQTDDGNHQQQVVELIEKTIDSLSDHAVKSLSVSIQQNDSDPRNEYAVKYEGSQINIVHGNQTQTTMNDNSQTVNSHNINDHRYFDQRYIDQRYIDQRTIQVIHPGSVPIPWRSYAFGVGGTVIGLASSTHHITNFCHLQQTRLNITEGADNSALYDPRNPEFTLVFLLLLTTFPRPVVNLINDFCGAISPS
ncbi:hypothetical protein D9758_016408 [Tetrapyrgos nigripes]|uniref:G domain-containing protein n=1 Tax=Tetrapyrgos nigripes TaxID=182062 RepID=A0A8H5FQ32_9AGAR|nr:hypothetical protein D9758_016408 [Tetrapyrgos nigripes]